MRTYRHWIKLPGTVSAKQNLKGLLLLQEAVKAQNYKVTTYRSEYNLLDRYFLVEAPHNYNDLELDVNSMSSPLQHLKQKPKDLFQIPKTLDQLVDYWQKVDIKLKGGQAI